MPRRLEGGGPVIEDETLKSVMKYEGEMKLLWQRYPELLPRSLPGWNANLRRIKDPHVLLNFVHMVHYGLYDKYGRSPPHQLYLQFVGSTLPVVPDSPNYH